jgi:TolA-binding protein
VKKLITQTLDPMLSAFFRDVAHKKTMLELLQQRDAIQAEAKRSCSERFEEFDIECVDVLIGKPDTAEAGGKIETLLEQLRQRQLSIEQIETYERQRGESQKVLKIGEAEAEVQRQKVESFGDPRLYASYLVAGQLAQSRQPLVPEHIITSGGETGVQNLMTTLLQMMVSEKAGITLPAAHAAKGVHPPAAA